MSTTPTFTGHVTTAGQLVLDDRSGLRQHVQTFRGKPVEVVVRKRQSKRSLDQNAYFHAVPVEIMGEHWGTSAEETKLLLLGECFGWRDVNGHQIPIKPSSSALTVEEFSRLIEWIPVWAMTEFKCHVPLPDECDWRAA